MRKLSPPLRDRSLIWTSVVTRVWQLLSRNREIIEQKEVNCNAAFACRSAVEEAVRATPRSVFNGRRHEDSTVTNIRADVDHSVSIVG